MKAASVTDAVSAPPAEPPVLPEKKISRKPMPIAPPAPIVEPLVPDPEEIEAAAGEELAPPRATEIEPEPEPEPLALEEAGETEPPPVNVSMRSHRFEAKQEKCNSKRLPAAVSKKRTKRFIAERISTNPLSAGAG